jgi:hypothetical protein
MASVDLAGSRKRPDVTPTTGEAPQRAGSGARPALEIGATFFVLVLIAISALAVRFLLSLPNGAMH